MTQKTIKKIHRLYGIVLSVVTVFAGICFIAACCNIYYSGKAGGASQIYTPEIVAAHFTKIAIPVYSCLTLVLGSILLNIALPLEKAKLAPEKNLTLILSRLQAKTDLDACEENLRLNIRQLAKQRKQLAALTAGLMSFGFVLFLCYACNAKHWGTNSTPSMISAMYMMLGCLAVPFALTVYTAFFCRKSTMAEIELMKKASAQAPQKAAQAPAEKAESWKMRIVPIALVALGIVLVVLGACNEGTKDILTKAVNICTECVGLG